VGVKLQWAHGHLIWVIMIVIGLGLVVATQFLPAKAEGRYEVPETEDAEVGDGFGREHTS
jgi:hypothetical protein